MVDIVTLHFCSRQWGQGISFSAASHLGLDVGGAETENYGLNTDMNEDNEECLADPVTSEQVRYMSDRYQSLVDQVRWLVSEWY